ncbi:DsbA family protein [Lentzea sp. JNUCC 0626]|uniref:DsbA family protein n=1 Tax=Lentzea sp. JNUCC 0626 TaxID=3367513 RepID=UPI003749F1AD
MTARLTYAFDAYCGWCYGFGPALRQFAADNTGRIDLHVLSGGLFSGPGARPTAAYPHIPEANNRITALTGVTFGQGYLDTLAEGTTVMDSTAAAKALIALRAQAPTRALELARALQEAWYVDGRSLSTPDTHRIVAEAHDLDPAAVVAAFQNPKTAAAARTEFRTLRRLGVDGYPTLLLHTDTGVHRLGGPVSTAAALTEALNRHLSPAL